MRFSLPNFFGNPSNGVGKWLTSALLILIFGAYAKAQALNPVSVETDEVYPGESVSVRVQIVNGTGQITVDISLVTPDGYLVEGSKRRYSQSNNIVVTHNFPISLGCDPRRTGWKVYVELPSSGSKRLSTDSFAINFNAAELYLEKLSTSGPLITLAKTLGATTSTATFLSTDPIYLRGLIRNSGCLAPTSTHSLSLELDGQSIAAYGIPGINANQEVPFEITPFALSSLPLGQHTLVVRLGGGSQLGSPISTSVTFTVVSPLPDLVLSNTSLFTDALTINSGTTGSRPIRGDERMSLRVGARNAGYSSGGPVSVTVTIRNLSTGTSSAPIKIPLTTNLAAGSNISSATFPLGTDYPGNYRIDFFVDGDLEVSESVESNNMESILFTILDGDLDGDGMPNSWEISNGFNEDLSTDAIADPDMDGTPNWLEYLSNLDPNNQQDKVSTEMRSANVLVLSHAVPGVAYAVERMNESGVFAPVPSLAFTVTTPEEQKEISLPATGSQVSIYRISLSRQ